MLRSCVGLAALLCLASCEGKVPAQAPASVQAPSSDPPQTDTRTSGVPASRGGSDLIGTRALPFAGDLEWLNAAPTQLEQLRGEVVLVRFWTDTCPFCEASAPGLSRLHDRYGPEGLRVIGLFHPKPRGAVRELDGIRARAKELGMNFPIASDTRWDTLERWWLGSGDRAATSVSFLIDAEGVIRWIHPGPEFHPDGPQDHAQCRLDYQDAVQAIETLLHERADAQKKVG